MEVLSILLEHLLPIVGSIVVPVAVTFICVLIKRWLDVDLSSRQRESLEMIASDAVRYAEEQALKAVKTNDDKPTSAKKLDTAIAYVVRQATVSGLPKLATDEIKDLIETDLGGKR
jgi:hypothetical protein